MTTASRGAGPMRPASAGSRGGRLQHLGEQGDAGQHRPAGEVAVEGRMVDGDLEPLRDRASISLVASAPVAAGAVRRRELGEPRRGELAGRLARQRVDLDDAARQEGGVDAVAQRREDLLARRAPGATTNATRRTTPAASPSLRAGIQNAPSTTPSIELRWKFEMADRAALAGDVDQVVGAAEQAEASAPRTSSTSASERRLAARGRR